MRRDLRTKKIVIMKFLEMNAVGHLKYKLQFPKLLAFMKFKSLIKLSSLLLLIFPSLFPLRL